VGGRRVRVECLLAPSRGGVLLLGETWSAELETRVYFMALSLTPPLSPPVVTILYREVVSERVLFVVSLVWRASFFVPNLFLANAERDF